MNCKPGELAIIVMCPRGTEHLRGKIIRVTTLAEPSRQAKGYSVDTTACWNYEGPIMKSSQGRPIMVVNDCCLRPLRGGEIEQQTDTRQIQLIDAQRGVEPRRHSRDGARRGLYAVGSNAG